MGVGEAKTQPNKKNLPKPTKPPKTFILVGFQEPVLDCPNNEYFFLLLAITLSILHQFFVGFCSR